MINILFAICIFLAVWTGVLIVGRMIKNQYVPPWQILVFAASATGIITHLLKVW